MNRFTIKLLASVFLCISFYACTEDYFEFDKIKTDDWRPNIAVPLISSSLTLEDIVLNEDSNGVILEDPNTKILELVYDGRVFSTVNEFKIDIPNQSFTETIAPPNAPLPGLPTSQNIVFSDNRLVAFNAQVEVDLLKLKDGDLAITLSNDFRHNLTVNIDLPSITDQNGQSISLSFSIPAKIGNTPSVRSQLIDLSEYSMDMTFGSQNHSTIPMDIQATITTTPNVGIAANEELEVKGELRNMAFEEFTGFVGQDTIELDLDTINVQLFRNFIAGELFLSNPTLDITVYNEYGAPSSLYFEVLKSRNEVNFPAEIDFTIPNNPVTLNYPTTFGVDSTKETFQKNNSNIAQVISSFPKSIIYKAEARLNEGNANGTNRNFVTDTSTIGLNVFLRIPFEGVAKGFYLVDTMDLTFDAIDELESGEIRVLATNTFPLEASVQLVFTDSVYKPIDSLFDFNPNTMRSAQSIFPPGEPNAPSSDIRDFPISRERLEGIAKGDKVLIKAFLDSRNANTSSPDTVRFRNNNRLDIAIGLKGTILID